MWTEMHTEAIRNFYKNRCPCCLVGDGMIHEDECPFHMLACLSWLLHVIICNGPQCADCGFWLRLDHYYPDPTKPVCERCRNKCSFCGSVELNIKQYVVRDDSADEQYKTMKACGGCSGLTHVGAD